MNAGVDCNGIGMQPVELNNKWKSLFFIIFIIFGNFFILNLFVGVVISTFNTQKDVIGKDFLLTST